MWGGGALVGLTLVVLASAFGRLALYEEAYGFTWPRLLVHAAILMLAALLACGLLAVVTGLGAWLPSAALAIALISLGALHVLDAYRFIADRNIDRFTELHSSARQTLTQCLTFDQLAGYVVS